VVLLPINLIDSPIDDYYILNIIILAYAQYHQTCTHYRDIFNYPGISLLLAI